MSDQSPSMAIRANGPILAPGHVWLAGAGPGDPGLLTLDAFAGLSQADVIVHDALVDPRVAGAPAIIVIGEIVAVREHLLGATRSAQSEAAL